METVCGYTVSKIRIIIGKKIVSRSLCTSLLGRLCAVEGYILLQRVRCRITLPQKQNRSMTTPCHWTVVEHEIIYPKNYKNLQYLYPLAAKIYRSNTFGIFRPLKMYLESISISFITFTTDYRHPMNAWIKETWNFGPMWQTKYASAVPINLGLGFDFWPCSEGDFLTGRL